MPSCDGVGGLLDAAAKSRILAAANTSAPAEAARLIRDKCHAQTANTSSIGDVRRLSTFMHVAARRRFKHRDTAAAQPARRRLLVAAALGQPRREVRPP